MQELKLGVYEKKGGGCGWGKRGGVRGKRVQSLLPLLFFQKNPNRSQSFFPSHGSLFFSTPPQLQPLSPFASVSASPHHHNTEQLARRRQRRSSPTGDTSLSSFFLQRARDRWDLRSPAVAHRAALATRASPSTSEATPSLLLSREIDARARSRRHVYAPQELPHPWPLHRAPAVGNITGDILFLGASSSRTRERSAFAFSSHIVLNRLCVISKVAAVGASFV